MLPDRVFHLHCNKYILFLLSPYSFAIDFYFFAFDHANGQLLIRYKTLSLALFSPTALRKDIRFHYQLSFAPCDWSFLLFDSFNLSAPWRVSVVYSRGFTSCSSVPAVSCPSVNTLRNWMDYFIKNTNSTYQNEHLNIHKMPYELTFCTYLYIHMYMQIYTQFTRYMPIIHIHFIYPLKQQQPRSRNRYELIIVYWTKLQLRLKVK